MTTRLLVAGCMLYGVYIKELKQILCSIIKLMTILDAGTVWLGVEVRKSGSEEIVIVLFGTWELISEFFGVWMFWDVWFEKCYVFSDV